MTERHELVVPLEDLARISITCGKCGAAVIGDFGDQRQGRLGHSETGLSCAVCHQKFDEYLKEVLVRLREAHEAYKQAKGSAQVSFHVAISGGNLGEKAPTKKV